MKKLICCIVMAFLCSCAGFREGKVSSINTFPQPDKKPSLNISLDFIVNMNGNTITNQATENNIKAKVIERFKASGLFSNVTLDSSGQEYSLNIKYEDRGDMNVFLSVLTGATLYIFPSYSKDTNIITAQLVNNKNKHKTEIVLNDSMTMWQQILLLPLTPFKHPLAEAVSMQNDLIDNLALQTYENIKNNTN